MQVSRQFARGRGGKRFFLAGPSGLPRTLVVLGITKVTIFVTSDEKRPLSRVRQRILDCQAGFRYVPSGLSLVGQVA